MVTPQLVVRFYPLLPQFCRTTLDGTPCTYVHAHAEYMCMWRRSPRFTCEAYLSMPLVPDRDAAAWRPTNAVSQLCQRHKAVPLLAQMVEGSDEPEEPKVDSKGRKFM